ncbi:MAG: hypothetical protein ACI4NZ_03340 [Candidatus Enterousia sp.]
MKISRILCSILVLSAFSGGAFAAPGLPGGQCYSTTNPGYDYTVYFEHARPTPAEENSTYRNVTPTATSDCLSDLERTLGALRPTSPDDCIILLGGADESGDNTGYDNIALSTRRVGLVAKMLTSLDENTDCFQAFYAGSANSVVQSPTIYNAKERSVRVIITRKSEVNNITLPEITINLTNNIQQTNNQSTVVSSTTQINVNYDDSELQAQQKTTEIGLIASELNRMNSEFDRSHWKTASGNFNGARLASDSIAGVVLGTAGGLITSNIIKKNQIRGGFEDLQCVIGGQIIADYNDEFTINMNVNR